MKLREFSIFELSVLMLCCFLLFALVFVLIVKKDWVDSLFYGSNDVNEQIVWEDPEYPPVQESDEDFVVLDFLFDNSGESSVVLELNSSMHFVGFELSMTTDSSLEIVDFTCEAPFECIYFESTDGSFSVSAITPINFTEDFSAGQLTLGSLSYTGRGNAYLDSSSFISDASEPELNVLSFSNSEFVFK